MKCEKPDQYDYLIALSALEASDDDVKAFTALDDSEVVLSDRTTEAIEKMIRKESVYRRSGFKRFGKILSRVAVIALVMISVTLSVLMGISARENALRDSTWEIVITTDAEGKVQAGFAPKEGKYVKEVPVIIEDERKPTIFLEGTAEILAYAYDIAIRYDYCADGNVYASFRQYILDESVVTLEYKNTQLTKTAVGNHLGFVIRGSTQTSLFWNDGEYVYWLQSESLDLQELIRMAESVK
jgi:hypothetical protein